MMIILINKNTCQVVTLYLINKNKININILNRLDPLKYNVEKFFLIALVGIVVYS